MRYRTAVALAAAAVMSAPGTALADKPIREVLPAPGPDTTEACGVPVRIEAVGQIIRKTWLDAEGNPVRAIETYPGFKYVLTNLDTGTQHSFSIAGPARYTYNIDGSTTVVGTGPWGWYGENPVTGEPGIFLIRGRLTFTFGGEGGFTFRLLSGHIVNVCGRVA